MKVLVLGAAGQVGHELSGSLACFADLTLATRLDADLTDRDALLRSVDSAAPDVIVNAASYNDVDGAEEDAATAMRVNGEAVAQLGELARTRRIGLVHYSTDFVFDGKKRAPYLESDAAAPLNVYGKSKLAGERALLEQEAPALIFRTAWVFGLRRQSFVSTILRAARHEERLRVVDDQLGTPTFCRDLANATAQILFGLRTDPYGAMREARGIYHVANAGICSRHELAVTALELDPNRHQHKVSAVLPVSTAERPSPAPRPLYTALDCSKAAGRFGIRLPPWRDALARAMGDSVRFV